MKKLFIFIGPSASGKTRLMNELVKRGSQVSVIPTITTRQPREGGGTNDAYTYVSEKEFHYLVQTGQMLEFSKYHDQFYGTKKNAIEQPGILLKATDIEGAQSFKVLLKNRCKIVFIDRPYSFIAEALKNREIPDEERAARLATVKEEAKQCRSVCDAVLHNTGTIDDLVKQFCQICKTR